MHIVNTSMLWTNKTVVLIYWDEHCYKPKKKRFSTESLKMATAIDNFMKLNYNDSTFFIEHYKELFNIDENALKSEMIVIKNCILRISKELDIGFDELKRAVQTKFTQIYILY